MKQELTKALKQKPDDAQYYCQRAYCHILLGNYCVAVANTKKSCELNPNNSTAMLRKGGWRHGVLLCHPSLSAMAPS
ncbi:protein SGT1 homolog [Pan troglodytes]|uniref:protein SGT1 homolog n=1 Tax=Pan troglodytes TaxID=9598 RepID=UPI0002743CA4